jgi:hypothetical protein
MAPQTWPQAAIRHTTRKTKCEYAGTSTVGRAGIEPATLGLNGPADRLGAVRSGRGSPANCSIPRATAESRIGVVRCGLWPHRGPLGTAHSGTKTEPDANVPAFGHLH